LQYVEDGDLDEAFRAVAPILDLPEDRQISWIKKRLGGLADALDVQQYAGSTGALDLKDPHPRIRDLTRVTPAC
jgi:hypothetical protein